ncbi:sensor histidine kinase YesM [Saonia flava]|uniref:Sensor histidine kinase YesM n=1 Tax=Saonia flava TaxID=523696 RepID=A0A846QVN5_9FLAO|nr:histidine kinase [Saonia flava]NJB70353.1 sensor histidine kinase YesM [Saonia flava]
MIRKDENENTMRKIMEKNDSMNDFLMDRRIYKKYIISYKHHIVFWSIYFGFNVLRWGSIHDNLLYSFKTNLIGFPIHIILTYFNIYYLMPKFIFTRKYFTYSVLLLACLSIMLLAKVNLISYLVGPLNETTDLELTVNSAIINMVGELYVISFVTAIKITIDWLRDNSKFHELEKRQLTTELRFLRSQISPHFFFNTLNNIYSLSLEKSDKTPQVILKLSDLMRYLLYATKKKRQSLKNEVDCIINYVDLERMRFSDSLEVDINITGDMDRCEIAPMLMVPLIENCFKHGANNNLGKIHITIDIKVENGILNFMASNTIPQNVVKEKKPRKNSGIGLSNVKKRLELGYNKEDYELSIFEEKNIFHVNLKLKV